MSLDFANLLQVAFLSLCIFGMLLLAGQARLRPLCWLLAAMALLMAFNVTEESGLTRQFHMLTPVFSLLWGPLFLLLVAALVGQPLERPAWQPAWLPVSHHFLPALLALPVSGQVQAVLLAGGISQFLYALAIWRLLANYRRASAAVRSDVAETSLGWLSAVLIWFAVLAFIDFVRHSLQPWLPLAVLEPWYRCMLAAQLCSVSFLIFHAVRTPRRFTGLTEYRQLMAQPEPAAHDVQYEQAQFALIRQHMLDERLYEQARLTLREVAGASGLLERDVSRAINLVGGVNFSDFVNAYRVEAVQRRIAQGDARALLDIALDCGFSSKSSFNTVFRRLSGTTPSAWAAQQASAAQLSAGTTPGAPLSPDAPISPST